MYNLSKSLTSAQQRAASHVYFYLACKHSALSFGPLMHSTYTHAHVPTSTHTSPTLAVRLFQVYYTEEWNSSTGRRGTTSDRCLYRLRPVGVERALGRMSVIERGNARAIFAGPVVGDRHFEFLSECFSSVETQVVSRPDARGLKDPNTCLFIKTDRVCAVC